VSLHEDGNFDESAEDGFIFAFQINKGVIFLISKKSCFRNILFNFFIRKYFRDCNK